MDTGKELQQKADEQKDEQVIKALLLSDISGLSREDALKYLKNVIEEIDEQ